MSELHLSAMEWHSQHISPLLHNISRHASWTKLHAQQLVARPTFETMAEHELEQAEAALERALSDVRDARREYACKTTENPCAA